MFRKNYPLGFALLFLGLVLNFNVSAQAINLEWAKNSTGTSTYSSNTVATTSDKQGYVYLTGFFSGVLYFGGDSLLSAIGNQDGFVLKVDASGKVIWARQFGYSGTNNNNCWDVKTDDSGNVYVTGYFLGTTDLNPGTGSKTITATGSWDVYVCKLDASGNFVWGKSMGGKGSDRGEYLAIDKSGDVYLSGYFNGTIDLNPGSRVDTFKTILGGSTTDYFICKMDASGNYLWGVQYQKTAGFDKIGGLALDPSGNVYMVGSYFNTMEFPASSGIPMLTAIRYYDYFLVKVNSAGKFVWAKSFGGTGDGDFGYDMVADENYNLYIVGNFNGTCNLDPNVPGNHNFKPTPNPTYPTLYYDVFVLKIDTGGNYIWATTFGSPDHDNGLAVAIDQANNVYVTGSVKDTVKFVPGSSKPEDMVVPNGGGQLNPFVAKFDASGKYVWSTTFGNDKGNNGSGIGTERGDDLTIDAFGNLYVAGIFNGVVDFDPPHNVDLDAAKGSVFFLKYGCNDTSSSSIERSNCGSYTYNGETYDSTGVYKQVFRNTSGCDSTVYLNLTISYIATPVITTSGFTLGVVGTYNTYQWLLNGSAIPGATNSNYTVTANGEYTVAVTNEYGCADTSLPYTVNNYTGIGNVRNLAKKVKIYPNPATDRVYITAPVAVNVSLSSIEGKLLLKVKNPGYITLDGLAYGVYFLRVTDQQGRLIKVEKLIKQ